MRNTPASSALNLGETTTLAIDWSHNSAGQAIATSNLYVLLDKTLEYVPSLGTVAPATITLGPAGSATATFTASATQSGQGSANARILWTGMGLYNYSVFPAPIQVGSLNSAPVANAGANQTVECTGVTSSVVLNGSASTDPDGNTLTYTWQEGANVVASGVTATVQLAHGAHTLTLTVSDGNGGTASDDVVITVADTQPPTLTLNGPASLTLELAASTYNEQGATAVDACVGNVNVQIGGSVNTNAAGTYTVSYTATDPSGNSAHATRTVHVQDTTAPVITVGAAPLVLSPPNHKYATVDVSALGISVQDLGGASAANVVITKVTSDEADNGLGDGDTPNDMVISPNGRSVQLRAERSGTGNGRVYVIHLGVRDASGNLGSATYRVSVPKTAKAAAVPDAVANTVVGVNP